MHYFLSSASQKKNIKKQPPQKHATLTPSCYHSSSPLKFERLQSACSFLWVWSKDICANHVNVWVFKSERETLLRRSPVQVVSSFRSLPPTSMYSARDGAGGGHVTWRWVSCVWTAMTVSHTLEWIYKGGATLGTPAQSRTFHLMRPFQKIPKTLTKNLLTHDQVVLVDKKVFTKCFSRVKLRFSLSSGIKFDMFFILRVFSLLQ